jgi:5-methylthioadenosine/S-adenosylhomocysteine deaminase
MRASIGLPIAPGADAAEVGAQLASAERLWDEYRASPWLNLHFAPGDSVALTEAALARVRTVADELDARIAMPVQVSRAEIELSVARAGVRPLERLAALGLLRPGFLALHMNHLSGEDLELAARTGIAVVICPQAGLYQGHGASPLRELLGRGVPLGLGSGSPAHAGALDLLAEARTAALVAGTAGEPALDAEAVLRLATLGGAMALGLAAVVGSIEPGKAADLITVDLGALSSQGGAQPLEAVLYGATREHVSDVWLSGNAAVSQGRLLAFDEQELIALRRSWSERLSAPWSASYSPAQARLGDWQ